MGEFRLVPTEAVMRYQRFAAPADERRMTRLLQGDEVPVCLTRECTTSVQMEFARYIARRDSPAAICAMIRSPSRSEHQKGVRLLEKRIAELTTRLDNEVSAVSEAYAANSYDHWEEYAGDGPGLLDASPDAAGPEPSITAAEPSADGAEPSADGAEPSRDRAYGMMRAIGSVIRDTCTDPKYLPPVKSLVYSAEGCGPDFEAYECAIVALMEVAERKCYSPVLAFLESPWLPRILRMFVEGGGLTKFYQSMPDEPELEKLALREIRFVACEANWKHINKHPHIHPFMFDENLAGETFPMSNARGSLEKILGFPPRELDLTRCGITGSTASFMLGPRFYFPDDHGTLMADRAPRWAQNPTTTWTNFKRLEENLFEARAQNGPDQELLKVRHAHDVDIAVFTKSPAVLEEVARELFGVFKGHYPDATLERREKGKCSFTWHIVAGEESFLRFPPIEIYRTSLGGVCSHHVAPVRACYTAAFGHPVDADTYVRDGERLASGPRWLATASALRAYHTRYLDNFHYFASRQTFPQEIIAKYIWRGYRLSDHVPRQVRREVLNYVLRHPDKPAGEHARNFKDYATHVRSSQCWLERLDDTWYTMPPNP